MATMRLNNPEINPLHNPNLRGAFERVEMAEKERERSLKKEYLLSPATLLGALK